MKNLFLITLNVFTIPFLLCGQTEQADPNGDPIALVRPLLLEDLEGVDPDLAHRVASVLEAGDAIEGDYIGDIKFSPDGEQVWVVHRTTNNISVIDWATKAIIDNIPVGTMPVALEFTQDLAVVACYSSREVYLIELSDHSVRSIIPTAPQPGRIRVSRDGSLAVVGCDEPDVAEVIDLYSGTLLNTVQNFPVYLYKFSFITSNPRNTVFWSGFEIAPDNSWIANGAGEGPLTFYDPYTGNILGTIPAITEAGNIELSGDGSRLLCVQTGNPGMVSQVDVADRSLLKQVEVNGRTVISTYSSMAVNDNGDRTLLPVSPGEVALVRFDQDDYQLISIGGSGPNWVGHSADRKYGIAGHYFLSVIDFETGNVLGNTDGIPIQNGAVSPMYNRIVASDPLRFEGLHYYNFDNPSFLEYEATTATGSELEADVSYSARISPDGKTVLVVNALSGTLSVIDAETESLRGIIPLGSWETYHTDITEDGRYALIGKRLTDEIAVVDLGSLEVVKNINSGGDRPDQVFVLPGRNKAYALNAGSNDGISVLELDGANSSLDRFFRSGNMGISWTNYGIRCNLAVTRDGKYGVLATPFDDKVQVFDLETDQVVAEVPLQGFPLQVAVSDETDIFGVFAAVTLKNDHKVVMIGAVGPNASPAGEFDSGMNPTRIAFNPVSRQFAVCSNDDHTLRYIDLESFEPAGELDFGPNYTPIAVEFDEQGSQFVLLRSENTAQPHLFRVNDEVFTLPALPIHNIDVSTDGKLAAIVTPGTDQLILVVAEPTGFRKVILSTEARFRYRTSPNPARGLVRFEALDKMPEGTSRVDIRVYALSGKMVHSQIGLPANGFLLDPGQLPSGTYFFNILDGSGNLLASGKIIRD